LKTYVWRGLDEPRMEIAYVDGPERAHGTQIGPSYELRWQLDGRVLDLQVVNGNHARIPLGDADFFDVLHSPFFNSLPVNRDGLLDAGPERSYVMTFVVVPQLTASLVPQTYLPLGDRVVRYRAGSFQADIEFDEDGIVTNYTDYLERLWPPDAS
jgi:uncharacterized protein